MKIIKFKKTSKDKYKLYLENNSTIDLYEDVIIKNNLLITKELDDDLILKIEKENNDISAYVSMLNYISIKMRSIKEAKEYLIKKGYNNTLINKVINRLINEGYLNDELFTKAFINDQLLITNNGPLKIRKELYNHNIDSNIIEDYINKIDNNSVEEKLTKLIEKQLKIKKDSANQIRLKLVTYFCNLGYEKDMILDILSNYEIKSDINKLQKDYDKLYKKYKDKYKEEKLNYFITQKLYLKGYSKEDIDNINT